jgi:hypothetical protein
MNALPSCGPNGVSEGWRVQEGRRQARTAQRANAWLFRLGDPKLRARREGGDPMPRKERKTTGKLRKIEAYKGQASTGGRGY